MTKNSDNIDPRLDSFDHVVVLMLENRSFDNLLGLIYPDGVPPGAPAGKDFAGVTVQMSNPVPSDAANQPPDGSGKVFVTKTGDYCQPYPDPGEEFEHINRQISGVPGGGGSPEDPTMEGFVADYIEKLEEPESKLHGKAPTFVQYSQIMQSFDPDALPVLSTLAREFGVFDHWYCSVPSQTWCNRAFWNAGTSWGRVNQSPFGPWFLHNHTDTLFNQISDAGTGLSWKVYHETPYIALTNIIHSGALIRHESHFHKLERFFEDCERGELPSYSFLEPDFILEHDDYHPSSAGWGIVDHKTGPGTVLLGERLVARIYNAIRTSQGRPGTGTGNTSQNTLLVITFDEHGGCFDHVKPINPVKSPDLDGYDLQGDFDFERSGIRVPTIMVSARIAPNTVINTPLMHTSFMTTMQAKWSLSQLSRRQQSDSMFTEVFTASTPRPADDWPVVAGPPLPKAFAAAALDDPLGDLQRSIVVGTAEMMRQRGIEMAESKTMALTATPEAIDNVGDALSYLAQARKALDRARVQRES